MILTDNSYLLDNLQSFIMPLMSFGITAQSETKTKWKKYN